MKNLSVVLILICFAIGMAGAYYLSYGFLIFLVLIGGGAIPRLIEVSRKTINLGNLDTGLAWVFGMFVFGSVKAGDEIKLSVVMVLAIVASMILSTVIIDRKSRPVPQATRTRKKM